MNMKKLIDEADFDNVQQISKRWKKQTPKSPLKDQIPDLVEILNASQVQKQNMHDSNIPKSYYQAQKDTGNPQSTITIQNNTKKRQVIPQVIDEDTEHFRNRLEHLLNTFKTDAVSEFMGMKKSMLDYQKQTIKGDTQKYLTMYQQKHQELLQTKQKLMQMTKQAQKKTIQCQLMSNHISKLNERIKITKYLSRPFSLLYQNKQKEKMLKLKFIQAAKADNKRMKNKCFGGWRNIYRDMKAQKDKENMQIRINSEVSDIVGRFQKQMEMLREQLNQSMRKNQQYENNKHMIQQNLKRAFLRGMSAMNMEAMGVLGDSDTNSSQHNMTNMNMSHSYANMAQSNQTQRTIGGVNNPLGNSMLNMTSQKALNMSSFTNQNNTSVMMGKVKTQSKEHKWKQAPIMGIQQNQQCEQPRPILVKPSTQGKVIKVVDGKSSTVDPKKKASTVGNNSGKQPHQVTANKSSLMSSRKNY